MNNKPKTIKKMLRINVVYSIIFLSFTGLVLRAAYVEIAKGPTFRNAEVNTQFVTVAEAPQRGWIYDANGQVLAWDTPSDNIVLDNFTTIPSNTLHNIANQLAPVLNETPQKLYHTMTTDKTDLQIPLATNATESQIAYVVEHNSDLPNVEITQTYQRQYPEGDLAGQVLGYVGSITAQNKSTYVDKDHYLISQKVGVTGIEEEYESTLQGKAGDEMLTVDPSTGAVQTVGSAPPALAGDNIQLTLDGHLQADAQNIVMNLIKQQNDQGIITNASAVMLNVKTGGVLSMVSYPYLNPNWFTDGKPITNAEANYLNSGAEVNYAIQDRQNPGSTVKPANLLTAFKQGAMSPDSTLYDAGLLYIGKTRLNEDMNMVFGELDPIRAIAVSSDVFFYQVGLQLGKWFGSSASSGGSYPPSDGSYQHYLNTDFAKGINELFQGEWDFGLGPKTGIDLPNEIGGQFYIYDTQQGLTVPYDLQQSEASIKKTGEYPNNGTPASLAEGGIGQSQEFTTMQLATYAMTLANNGKKLQPHLLDKVYNSSDTPTNGAKPVSTYKTKVTGQVSGSAQDYALIRQAMYDVTTGGEDATANGLFNNSPYQVAAKTGTAQITIHGQKTDNSVFICYAPLNNPQVAMAVMIPGGGYGASLAGVIAKQMLDAYFDEHHASFMPKQDWTNTQIPSNWASSPANQLP
ncbi:penicillin-binding transpeptidase domain-containing protein [Alicyclobacillus fastidiosus]|uniref:Penicillin-binding transpeptidase domain-containing protein n=1 Tax=Alicyclobacillus fastidiosus TaxID=392011 RepID=A0ABY6ZJF1_9BACL|nr:penicillin-binding transpeptidase domain-containing protein [Alicyclobacillus fastidiosus]WAH42999.1 penicillin-binding transpeptidase domain-containing protein [Alicyclobacillus fastidiosus]GMA64969.1 penicillin-binding protein 2 [Alicyclobacillus fastidiosus]